jgi:hypothetical protein
MQTTLLMTSFRQKVTTTYNAKTWMITDVQPTSSADIMPVNATDYDIIWDMISHMAESRSAEDSIAIESFFLHLTWLCRTYGVFPANEAKMRQHLQNFLAIRMQFGTMTAQLINYTLSDQGLTLGVFALPADMHTRATYGHSVQLFKPQPWTPWIFLLAGWGSTCGCGIYILWVLYQEEPVPEGTGIPEIDISSRIIGRDDGGREKATIATTDGSEISSFGSFVKGMTPEERSSVSRTAKLLRKSRIMFARPLSAERAGNNSEDRALLMVREAPIAIPMTLERNEEEAGTATSTDSSTIRSVELPGRRRASSSP